MRWLAFASAFTLAWAASPGGARAEGKSGVEEARMHYNRGLAAHGLGHYAEAADEYEKAYLAKPDPALLFNAAQAHRLAGHRQRALELYQNYLRLFGGQVQRRDEVEHHITELKALPDEAPVAQPAAPPPPAAAIATPAPAAPSPPRAAAAPAPPRAAAPPPVAAAAAAPTAPAAAAPPPVAAAAAPTAPAAAATPPPAVRLAAPAPTAPPVAAAPTATAPVAAAPVAAAPVATAPVAAAPVAAVTPPSPDAPAPERSIAKRGWFWAALVGVAAVVGGGVALGVVLGSGSAQNPAPSFGAVGVR